MEGGRFELVIPRPLREIPMGLSAFLGDIQERSIGTLVALTSIRKVALIR